ncbi:HutD family protein, partial [Rhizobium sp. SIMBA_035]
MATATLIRGADLVAAPWKNGGGVTREVAAFPEGAG